MEGWKIKLYANSFGNIEKVSSLQNNRKYKIEDIVDVIDDDVLVRSIIEKYYSGTELCRDINPIRQSHIHEKSVSKHGKIVMFPFKYLMKKGSVARCSAILSEIKIE